MARCSPSTYSGTLNHNAWFPRTITPHPCMTDGTTLKLSGFGCCFFPCCHFYPTSLLLSHEFWPYLRPVCSPSVKWFSFILLVNRNTAISNTLLKTCQNIKVAMMLMCSNCISFYAFYYRTSFYGKVKARIMSSRSSRLIKTLKFSQSAEVNQTLMTWGSPFFWCWIHKHVSGQQRSWVQRSTKSDPPPSQKGWWVSNNIHFHGGGVSHWSKWMNRR